MHFKIISIHAGQYLPVTHIFSIPESIPSSGHEANTSRVRFPCRVNNGSRDGSAPAVAVVAIAVY